jgi:hypothetical protein
MHQKADLPAVARGPPSHKAAADAPAFVFSLRSKRRRERVKGIEPSCAAWEAAVLPLNYTRVCEKRTPKAFASEWSMVIRE